MRLDKFLTEKYKSRNKAARAIEDGLVLVNGKPVNASYNVKESDDIVCLEAKENYVSAGGFKLAKALKDFKVDVNDKVFIDVGASTGGFTDCLLQNGAKKVYSVDVGESQLDNSLLNKNVVVIDNFNARNLSIDLFKEKIEGVVVDVSFISLTYLLEQISSAISDGVDVFALIKPQFECESRSVGKNGIVKDKNIHKNVIQKIYNFANLCKLAPVNLTNAPIKRGKNYEFIIHLSKNGKAAPFNTLINKVKL